MDSLNYIFQRCHERRKKPLLQRKTVVKPALYNKGYPYHLTVYCAYKYPLLLGDMENAQISFMPIGRAPDNDTGPRTLGGDRFFKRQRVQDWGMRRWHASWGIQVYTGIPSEFDGARWHDFYFSYKSICDFPDAVLTCIETLTNAVSTPLLTLSKSGGIRFSCRIPDYLHPDTEDGKPYIYKHAPTTDNPYSRHIYLKIHGEKGYSRWDARYEILLGNLLDPPVIDKEVVFAPIDALRAELHKPAPKKIKEDKAIPKVPTSLGSHNIDLAKDTLIQRGFSYVRQHNESYLWSPPDNVPRDRYISLWENEDTVWIRASSTDIGLPTIPTPITDVWDDTGIVTQPLLVGMPISDTILTVRKGKLSPLAIKRPSPLLQKSKQIKINGVQTQDIFDNTDRILGLIADVGTENNYEADSYVHNVGATCLNVPTYEFAEELENRYQNQNLQLYER